MGITAFFIAPDVTSERAIAGTEKRSVPVMSGLPSSFYGYILPEYEAALTILQFRIKWPHTNHYALCAAGPAEENALYRGPRQVGTTTLAKEILASESPGGRYFDWDCDEGRQDILTKRWSSDNRLLVFDELHKCSRWEGWIIGWGARSPCPIWPRTSRFLPKPPRPGLRSWSECILSFVSAPTRGT